MFATQSELNEAVDKSPSANKVNKADIEKRIVSTEFFVLPGTTCTICNLIFDNGYSVRGESACVDPLNYNKDIGETYAYESAFSQTWVLFGFLLAEKLHWMKTQERELGVLLALGSQEGY